MPLKSRRIGQRALERVALAAERAREIGEARADGLETAAVVLRERVLAANDVEARAPLRARFREDERAVGEIEREQAELLGELRAALAKVESPGNHQVQNEKEVAVELEDDALSEPAHARDFFFLLPRRAAGRTTEPEMGFRDECPR